MVNGAVSLRGASVPSRVGEGHKHVLENVTTRHPPTGERNVQELQSRHGPVAQRAVQVRQGRWIGNTSNLEPVLARKPSMEERIVLE